MAKKKTAATKKPAATKTTKGSSHASRKSKKPATKSKPVPKSAATRPATKKRAANIRSKPVSAGPSPAIDASKCDSQQPSPKSSETAVLSLPIPPWIKEKPKAVEKWRELIEELQIRSLLVTIDLGLFALFCAAWQDFADASEEVERQGLYFETSKGYIGIHPAELTKRDTIKRIISLGDRLGIGARARKGLRTQPGDGDGSGDPVEQDPLVAYSKLKNSK